MINKVVLVGYAGRDPEAKVISDSQFATFPVATHESFKTVSGEWKEYTEWHTIEVWRGLAEKVNRQVKRGSTVYIEGKIKRHVYEDPNGIKKYYTRIIASEIRVIDKRKEQENEAEDMQISESSSNLEVETGKRRVKQAVMVEHLQEDLPF